jgi:hypothetical protein
MPDITTTIESSEATVKAVRETVPVGIGGEAIQRIPYSPALEKLIESGTTSRVIASTTRCIRIVEVPIKGGGTAKFHCSRACVGVNGQQLCPDHDRAAFAPAQNATGPKPAVTNSASIHLTEAELRDMGIKDPAIEGGNVVTKAPPTPKPKPLAKPLPKPSPKPKRAPVGNVVDKIGIELGLDDLGTHDFSGLMSRLLISALDQLPATNIARMKQIVALQERIQEWGAHHD